MGDQGMVRALPILMQGPTELLSYCFLRKTAGSVLESASTSQSARFSFMNGKGMFRADRPAEAVEIASPENRD